MMTPQWIVRCLKRDLAGQEQRIRYAEMVALGKGDHAHLYAEAAEILKHETNSELTS